MKKQLVIIGIVAILVSVALSGCSTEQINQGNGIQLINIIISTKWKMEPYTYPIKSYTESGFYHNMPTDAYDCEYIINGTVINNGELGSFTITVDLYDINNNLLQNGDYLFTEFIYNLPHSYTKDFSISISEYTSQYFDEVNQINFRIT
jgi:hypothetical protein